MADKSFLELITVDSGTEDLQDILNVSSRQLGSEKLSRNIDFIMSELCCRMVPHESESSTGVGAGKRILERIRMMLKIKSVAHCQDDVGLRTNSSETALEETLITNCIMVLHQLSSRDDEYVISVVCDILGLSLLIILKQGSDNLFWSILGDRTDKCLDALLLFVETVTFGGDRDATDIFKAVVNLQILETLIDVLSIAKDRMMLESNSTKLQVVDNRQFHDLVLELILRTNDIVTAQTLLCLIPKFVACTCSNTLLVNIWTHISLWLCDDVSSSTLTIPRAFLILCTLADYFLPESTAATVATFSLVEDSAFWLLVQQGLVHDDSLLRKQGLYLMKRAIDRLHLNAVSVDGSNNVMTWDPDKAVEMMETWEHFFLVLETLEEKQVHLIQPVLLIVDNLVKDEAHYLHESWITCVYRRIIMHDNNLIVKWGIETLLLLDVKYFISQDMKAFLELLLNTLNNSYLFSRSSNTLSCASDNLVKFFTTLSLLPQEACNVFSDLINVLSSISWDPVPLFFVVHALATLPDTPAFDSVALSAIRSFVSDALGTQKVYIRGGIQCQLLLSITHLTDPSRVDLATVCHVLGCFQRSESLHRGTHLWTNTVAWLNSFCDLEQAHTFVHLAVTSLTANQQGTMEVGKSLTDAKSLARMILLLSDAGLLEQDNRGQSETRNAIRSLQSMFVCFKDCEVRLYACEATQNKVLELLMHLVQEAATADKTVDEHVASKVIVLMIHSVLKDVLIFIKRRIFALSHLRNYHDVNLYIDALVTFSSDPNFYSVVANSLEMFQDLAIQMNTVYSETSQEALCSPLQKYTSVRLLAWISECLRNDVFRCQSVIMKQDDFIEEMIKCGCLNSVLTKSVSELDLTRDLQMLWGRTVSTYVQAKWRIFRLYLQSHPQSSSPTWQADVLECLEVGGHDVLMDIMQVLQVILTTLRGSDTDQTAVEVMHRCWVATFELRKVELFWTAMKQFVWMAFQKTTMDNVWLQPHLKKYAREIFTQGHAVTGLANILMVRLQEEMSAELLGTYSQVLVDALVFGPLHRRDQKVEDDTVAYIKSLGKKCSTNELIMCECRMDNRVRAAGVALLLRAVNNNNNNNNTAVAATIMQDLLQRDEDETARKTRYFGDSKVHRLKHRVMQSLLVLSTVLGKTAGDGLYAVLCASLLTANHQPSVRHQQEWLLCRLLVRWPHMRDNVWEVFSSAAVERPGSMCSFIAVAYLTARSLSNADTQEAFIDNTIRMTFPWCMAQHFNVRIYAQVTLKKLWELSERKGLHRILEKYALVLSSLQIGVDHGNAFKNAAKLQEDFYLNTFDPAAHFTLSTIYCELPRLGNVTNAELLPVEMLAACGVDSDQPLLPLRNNDTTLEKQAVADWVMKPTGDSGYDESSCEEMRYVVQKKIIPWRAMLPDTCTLLSSSQGENRFKRRSKDNGLIVVASLVDRPPNLGGLCRTCEVFGATEYVIGHAKYVQDKQFQSLSVSAERWIPISEVKPAALSQYLAAKKKDGYTVIGAEQTSNSVLINHLTFPKKTLLLLGNEKEGVPADLLPLLDVCVAVPQQGLVRSLNVHVTGAIFVWEYSRQHHLS